MGTKTTGGEHALSSKDDAAAAAAGGMGVLLSLELGVGLGARAWCSSWTTGSLLLVVLADLTDELGERGVDVDALLGRGLEELATEMFREVSALVVPDLTFVLEVTLVADDDDGEGVAVLDTEDLLVEGTDLLEGVAGGDGVDEEEAFACAHVLLSHRTVFFLAGGVEDVEEGYFFVDHALLAVRVFDGGIVLVYEVALDELDGQGAFADTTTADDDELVLSEELRARHVERVDF